MNKQLQNISIIGNGISGITCAREVRKRNPDVKIKVISGETEYFFSRTALMYIYMGHMKFEHTKPYEDWFWEKNRIELKKAWVSSIDFENQQLIYADGTKEPYETLVLALGSTPNTFAWKGEDLKAVQGLYSFQDLEAMEANTQDIERAVIVGGGLIGVEMAEMLRSRGIQVTFLVREKNFWDNVLPEEEAKLINRHLLEHEIDLRLETELEEIIGDEKGRVKAVKTKSGDLITCQFVGLTAGVSPNISFLKESSPETNKGILIDAYFQTNIPNVYAIGDCAEFRVPPGPDRKNIEQVWYTGRMHGETLAHNLCEPANPRPYLPGVWFNSAKFFDIEYQTYGHLPNQWEDDKASFYWEHASGKICLRLLFRKADHAILAVNALGWRMRHEFFDRAIREAWPVEKVLKHLNQANFDPEFYRKHHEQVIWAFNQQFDSDIKPYKASFVQRLMGSGT